jgi:hypothetical protein
MKLKTTNLIVGVVALIGSALLFGAADTFAATPPE